MASTNRKPSRYKEVCKEVFSADYNSDEIQQHNLKKLIFYASTNPDKLDAMGAYLLAKVGRRIKKGYDGHISVTMIVYDTLIKSCHIHVPLFGKHVVAACKLLLTSRPQCSGVAISTFKTYVLYLDDMTQLDWNFFVLHFNKMIAPNASEDSRLNGLAGLAGFIQSAENFDAFVARYVGTLVEADQKKAVDAGHNVLWNVLSSSAEPSEGMKAVIAALGARVNPITLRQCLEIMIKYFAKGSNSSSWIDLFGLISVSFVRETIIVLAQSVASFPEADLIPIISKLLEKADFSAPFLDGIEALVSSKNSPKIADCILQIVSRANVFEQLEAVYLLLKSNGNFENVAEQICAKFGENSLNRGTFIDEVVTIAKQKGLMSIENAVLRAVKSEGFGSLISPNVGISFPEESETANLVKEFAKAETLEQHFGNFDQRRKDVPTFFAEKPTILAEKFNDKGKEELQNF